MNCGFKAGNQFMNCLEHEIDCCLPRRGAMISVMNGFCERVFFVVDFDCKKCLRAKLLTHMSSHMWMLKFGNENICCVGRQSWCLRDAVPVHTRGILRSALLY